jgi:hypothetical protein
MTKELLGPFLCRHLGPCLTPDPQFQGRRLARASRETPVQFLVVEWPEISSGLQNIHVEATE